jgi:hypothetical protein
MGLGFLAYVLEGGGMMATLYSRDDVEIETRDDKVYIYPECWCDNCSVSLDMQEAAMLADAIRLWLEGAL